MAGIDDNKVACGGDSAKKRMTHERWGDMVVAAAIAVLSAWGTVAYTYGSMTAQQAELTARVATLTQEKSAEDNRLEILSEQMAGMQATLSDIKDELAKRP